MSIQIIRAHHQTK